MKVVLSPVLRGAWMEVLVRDTRDKDFLLLDYEISTKSQLFY